MTLENNVYARTYSMSVSAQLINLLLESSHLLHGEIALKVRLCHAHLHVVCCLATMHTHPHHIYIAYRPHTHTDTHTLIDTTSIN